MVQLNMHYAVASSTGMYLTMFTALAATINMLIFKRIDVSYITITINWLLRSILVEWDLVAQLQQVTGSSLEGERKAHGHSCIATSALCTGNLNVYKLYALDTIRNQWKCSYFEGRSCLSHS